MQTIYHFSSQLYLRKAWGEFPHFSPTNVFRTWVCTAKYKLLFGWWRYTTQCSNAIVSSFWSKLHKFTVCCSTRFYSSSNCCYYAHIFTNPKLHHPLFLFSSSLFLSETTSIAQGTRCWAWPVWPKTSWQRSLTSCCLLWRVGGLSPALLCQPPPTPPQCPLLQPLLLPPTCTPENEGTEQSSTVVCNILSKGGSMFVSVCVYLSVAWFGVRLVFTVNLKGHLQEENTFNSQC